VERRTENRVLIRITTHIGRQLVIMENVVPCAERDISGLSEADKQCDIQWVCNLRRRLSRIASFFNREFVQEISVWCSPPAKQWTFMLRTTTDMSVIVDVVA
jgi:hypothetical protein